MVVKVFAASLVTAWEMLLDFPLPRSLKMKAGEIHYDDELFAPLTQLFFPVAGLICGFMVLIAGGILSMLLPKVAGALIFSILLLILTEAKDSGRSLGAFVSFFSRKAEKEANARALLTLDTDIKSAYGPIGNLILILTVLFKIFCFYVMFYYGYYYWMTAVFILEFTVQGHMAAAPSLISGEPLLDVKNDSRFYIWAIAGFFTLFIAFEAATLCLVAFGVAFVFAHVFRQYCEKRLSGVDVNIISLAGYWSELFALLLGTLWLAGN